MGWVSGQLGAHLLVSDCHHFDPYIPGSFAFPASSFSCKSTQDPVNRATTECEQEVVRGGGYREFDGCKRGFVTEGWAGMSHKSSQSLSLTFWASHLTNLSPSVLICKLQVIMLKR